MDYLYLYWRYNSYEVRYNSNIKLNKTFKHTYFFLFIALSIHSKKDFGLFIYAINFIVFSTLNPKYSSRSVRSIGRARRSDSRIKTLVLLRHDFILFVGYRNCICSPTSVTNISQFSSLQIRTYFWNLESIFSAMAILHWFPTVIYRIIRILEIPNCVIFRTVANTFHWLGPILNPIMYSFMSAKFRRQLMWTLRCTSLTKDSFK